MEIPSNSRIVIDLSSDDEDVVMLEAPSKGRQGSFSEIEELEFDQFPRDDGLWDDEFDIPPPLPPSPGLDAVEDDLLQFSAGVDRWRQVLDADDAILKHEDQNPLQFDLGFAPNLPGDNQPADSVRESASDTEIPGKSMCMSGVLELFPDICPNHVAKLYEEYIGRKTVENIVDLILQSVEKGGSYPKTKQLKRKRVLEDDKDDDDEAARKYTSVDRATVTHDYRVLVRAILSGEFCYTPMQYIDHTLSVSKYHLYPAYQTLEEIERTWNPQDPTYQKLKQPRKINRFYRPDAVEEAISSPSTTPDLLLSLTELRAARMARARTEQRLAAEIMSAQAEKENEEQARRDGTMQDCGCCFTEFAMNRMVHCSSETEFHWFCMVCPKAYAETQVGQGKHELVCFSTDTCQGGFSNDQRQLFMDEKLTIALDRIEAEAALRLAGIENLESCPFCPFAAEYPPVEETKLFYCQNEFCYTVSCRLCKKESHIPKSCEEFAKENGLSVRRQIEEAMTSAMIRLCNKCKTPFIKEEGCNKMSCKCGNVQCYVCSNSCGYDHFNDVARGGKSGNCPLFDDVEKRHTEEVQKAAKDVLAKVRAEHPEYTEEDLEIKVSDNVKSDEEKRKKRHVKPRLPPNFLEYERVIQARPFNQALYGHGHADVPVRRALFDALPPNMFDADGDYGLAAYEAFRRGFEIDAAGNPLNPAPNPAQPAALAPIMNHMMRAEHRLGAVHGRHDQRAGPAHPPQAPAQAAPQAPAPAQEPRRRPHQLNAADLNQLRTAELQRLQRLNGQAYARQGAGAAAAEHPPQHLAPAPSRRDPALDDDDFGDEPHERIRGALRAEERRDRARARRGVDALRLQVPDAAFAGGVPGALARLEARVTPPPAVPVAQMGQGRQRGAVARVRQRWDAVAAGVVAMGRAYIVPGPRMRQR